MFVSNNQASFHLWWKEKLVKHQNVSKYYENDSSSLLSLTNNFTVGLTNNFAGLHKSKCKDFKSHIEYMTVSYGLPTLKCGDRNNTYDKDCDEDSYKRF